MAYYSPGDIYINSITINTQGGAVSLIAHMQFMTIYEDITLPGMNIELVVLDPYELEVKLPIVGEETLEIDFNTPSLGSFTHTFLVTSLNDVSASASQKDRIYRITGVATEVATHKTTLVNKAYNENIDQIVSDIFHSFLSSNKSLMTEPTRGIHQLIVTNKKPFTAIKDILARAVSDRHESSSYVFFENAQGYHFRTLEDLAGQGSVAQFTNGEVVADSIFRPMLFRNILAFSLPDNWNTMQKLGRGAFASNIKRFDHKNLLFGTKDVEPDVESMVRTMAGALSSGMFKSAHSGVGSTRFVPKDSLQPETHINEMIPNRAAYSAEMDQVKLQLKIYGDSTITAGQVVDVRLVETQVLEQDKPPHPFLAGSYLISKLKHVIYSSDVKPQYTQMLECISGSFATSPG